MASVKAHAPGYSERKFEHEPIMDYELRHPHLMFTEKMRMDANVACRIASEEGTVDHTFFVRLHNVAAYGRSHQARHFFTKLVLTAPSYNFYMQDSYIDSFPKAPDSAYTLGDGREFIMPGLPILPFNIDDISGAFMAAQGILAQPDNK